MHTFHMVKRTAVKSTVTRTVKRMLAVINVLYKLYNNPDNTKKYDY
jgi:hypothetical protein